MSGEEPERVAWWEYAGLALCALAFVIVRWPLYVRPGLLLGWNSDAALLGLMVRSMVEGDIPLLFWACDYLWPLTSAFAALAGESLVHDVGPLSLRLGVAIEVLAALFFYHAALRRVVGRRAALLATLWLAAGPLFLFRLTYAPLSAEQYFFLAAIAFWYVVRAPFTRLHQWLVLGLLAGVGWWIHRGVSFVIAPALLVILWWDGPRRSRLDLPVAAFVFLAGAGLGYLPAAIGRLEVDQRLYAPIVSAWRPYFVWQQLAGTLRQDFWALLGAEGPARWILGVAFVALLASAARHFTLRRETALAAGVIVTAFAFWFLSAEATGGALRYIMVTLPILYAFAAAELIRLGDTRRTMHRVLAIALAAFIGGSLFAARHHDVREIVAARREVFEQWGGFDPRPTLRAVADGHYAVCYADVWVAHKLEWLSEPTVPFIPYRSVNRRMIASLRLTGVRGSKCFVDGEGRVSTLTPAQEAAFRIDTLHLAEGHR